VKDSEGLAAVVLAQAEAKERETRFTSLYSILAWQATV
jgi:hypothetical protein